MYSVYVPPLFGLAIVSTLDFCHSNGTNMRKHLLQFAVSFAERKIANVEGGLLMQQLARAVVKPTLTDGKNAIIHTVPAVIYQYVRHTAIHPEFQRA